MPEETYVYVVTSHLLEIDTVEEALSHFDVDEVFEEVKDAHYYCIEGLDNNEKVTYCSPLKQNEIAAYIIKDAKYTINRVRLNK